mmetsp:Transcript_29169/g.82260  ORF Transcript_29169/g.82260 Transcript_29169/m.82260 type:complete len:327 (-) Transcript_29169:90-1070(-)|eukprot:CAMPEP_0117662870 /NCGR_PEP_ID=MMETSP0804-20121206/8281_1 /TAXON_ID=1074897 /ORGANISM="Tetraselmis astigmatica, Strain CCMP880" /LENGTH=326 /DNA_ID=CAMNT_0005469793 /DNA_START=92 /DNA_END=1072 /DNA_ORIENTATION=+
MKFLSALACEQALPMELTISAMSTAFVELSTGEADVPLRSRTPAQREGIMITMPGHLRRSGSLGVKLVSVFPQNAEKRLPMIHALVVAMDPNTGVPLAVIEGAALTAIRTAAGSAAATQVLARPEATSLAVIGTGVQARSHVRAMCAVRGITKMWVFGRDRARARAFADEIVADPSLPTDVTVTDSAEDAVRDADVICTATTSSRPVFDGRCVKAGAHINAVGSFTASMQEVDGATLKRALVTFDSREAVLAEAGDIVVALQSGAISERDLHAEIGEIINGTKPGRSSPEQITYFKSVGVAVQDVAAASLAWQQACEHNIGTDVDM